MIIQLIAHACFKIQDKTGADGVTIVTDPFDKSIGTKAPNFEANIITVSQKNKFHNNVKSLRGKPFVIDSAGEYDIKEILVQGVDADEKKDAGLMFRVEVEGVSISHLGRLNKALSDKQLSVFSGTDILLIPIGGKDTLDAVKAAEVVAQIEPRIVIPMQYKTPGIKIDGLASVEKFVKEIGLKPTEEEKLKIVKKDLPQEDMELLILSNSK